MAGLVQFKMLRRKAAEGLYARNAELFDFLAQPGQRLDGGANLQAAALYPAGQNAPNKRVIAQCGGQHLKIIADLSGLFGRIYVVHNQIKQG